MTRKQLETRARKLAQRFYTDAQALFDDVGMSDEIYETEIFQALVTAQGDAEEVYLAE